MAKHEFCDHCPGCRPALLNAQTGQVMADDDPIMIAVNKVWNHDTTYDMRKAFIEVTLHNSEDERDRSLAGQVISKIQDALLPPSYVPKRKRSN